MPYVDERLKLIDTVPDTFVDRVDGLRQGLFNELSSLLASLDTKGGRLVASEANMQRIETLIDGLGNYLFGTESEYLFALQDFLGQLEVSAALGEKFFKVPRTEKYAAVLRSQQFKTAKIFDKERISAELGTLIRNEITNLVASEAEVAQASIFLRDFVLGTPDLQPRLTRYAKTWALTSFANAERQYVFTIAEDVGVQKWLYMGGLVKDSRPFCEERAGNEYTTEEVKAWAALDWAGKIAGTNESTIFTACGGWNCRHVLMPVLGQ
jgi:hypothetical protein